ncbi:PTB domain engulfment adapter [Arabidopsis thaliana]|uniref:PTB domain engulfment adapter n=4 Tax=Arabidopsis thaliana TaxID=3702 RepID=A0A1P8B0F3_ARATH|nr:PTB domain engulfment adapter [Arabidopsis thaliana]ANM62370.1 PTB domain engulfment adapter [Arabidopsis thaliana]|eukprot:NP_001324531.1 PTB domain engulfment adapter [Arabidopsis thaliana]
MLMVKKEDNDSSHTKQKKTMASLFTPSPTTTSSSGDTIYVAAVPLKAAAGPPQLIMSMAYSLNISNLQHFMVLIKPSSPIRQEVLVFDFQPRNPESIEAAISLLSGNLIPGVVLQRRLKNVPRQRCWMVGPSKGNDAMEMAMEFNKSWETDLRVGFHDCRHYTNGLVLYKL